MQGAENQESRFLLRGDATSIQTSHCRINLRLIFPLFYYKQIHYKTLTSEGNIFFSA